MTPHPALVQALGHHDALRVAPHMTPVRLIEGGTLFTHGRRTPCLYLLCEGRLRAAHVTPDTVLTLGDLSPGAWVGEVGVIDGGPSTATVVALESSRLLELARDDLIRLQHDDPEAAAALLGHICTSLATRLRRSSTGVLDHVRDGGWRATPLAVRTGWWRHLLGTIHGGTT